MIRLAVTLRCLISDLRDPASRRVTRKAGADDARKDDLISEGKKPSASVICHDAVLKNIPANEGMKPLCDQ